MIENYVGVPDLNLISPKNSAKIIFPLIYFISIDGFLRDRTSEPAVHFLPA